MTIKDSTYVKIRSVNPLHLIINKVNGFYDEIDKNSYLTLVATNESKEIIIIKKKKRKKENLWSKIRDLIRSITKTSDDYGEKCVKIKFKSDDKLPLNKTIEIPSII